MTDFVDLPTESFPDGWVVNVRDWGTEVHVYVERPANDIQYLVIERREPRERGADPREELDHSDSDCSGWVKTDEIPDSVLEYARAKARIVAEGHSNVK